MTTPVRIQLRRVKGWRMPAGTVKVDRSTRWGNPCRCDANGIPRAHDGTEIALNGMRAVGGASGKPSPIIAAMLAEGYRWWISQPAQKNLRAEIRRELRGKNLGCWCPLTIDYDFRWKNGSDHWPCHADILLELANA